MPFSLTSSCVSYDSFVYAFSINIIDDFLMKRDFTGGLAFLEFKLKCRDGDTKDLLLWIGYCAFHLGHFKRAEDAYKELLDSHDVPKTV